MKWILLGLALWTGPAAVGELQSAAPGKAGQSYQLANHWLGVTVRHPFRVLRFEADQFNGFLRMVPGDFSRGLWIKLKTPVKSLLEGFPKGMRKELNLFFDAHQLTGPLSVSVRGIDAVRIPKGSEGRAEMEMHADVEVGGRKFVVPVTLGCERDGHVVRCRVSGRCKLSDVLQAVPKKWGLPMEDSVGISGEMSFSPKE